jgi:hypothetical protein
MKRMMLLAVTAGALMVPATAGASNGIGGIGAGGAPACAALMGTSHPKFASVHSVAGYPGPPGPFAGPDSVIDWSQQVGDGKNNGTGLIGLCHSLQ